MTDTTTRLLTRLLDEPTHLAALRSLEPRRFVALVRSVSLEDAGELLAMATAPQTLAMLDEELWRADSGVEERFDPERFAIWLEVLLVAAGKPDGSAYALLEASRDALAITAAGLERLCVTADDDAWPHLRRVGVDGLFRLGWRASAGETTD